MSSVYPSDHGLTQFIKHINHPCAGLPGLKPTAPPMQPMTPPSTHLHTGEGKGGTADHKAEDTFELTPATTGAEWETAKKKLMQRAADQHIYTIKTSEVWPSHWVAATEESLTPQTFDAAEQYTAEFTPTGGVSLVLTTTKIVKKTIASFDTFADAQTSAKALNELKGY